MRGKVGKWRTIWVWNDVKVKGRTGTCWGLRQLHEGPDTVEELLDRHLVKKDKTKDDNSSDELLNRSRLTSTRREALSLYRDILRASRFFTWPDSNGVLWRDVLRDSARREFELARFETDPEIVTRLLIGGHEAVHSAIDKLTEKQRQQIQKDRGGSDQR
ncbi:Complex 1 LYR protein [Sesbania bispinosa]|nr:Complex 1 LYR protein [Sesbania bispinosa]